MTDHHRSRAWVKVRNRVRPIFQARINAGGMPCVNRCVMGGIVYPGQAWDVAHLIDAAKGGTDDMSNLGAAHRRCNRSDGGTQGAIKTNQARAQKRNAESRNQPW
ncbi:HNH endonuclease [Frigoribacterium sp. VKM Ac-2836]|uniref:HNH endonuclease n=1 Tax=Frigoribacterium sp. VKM Ac-2836 TaxID=2739014 RepID=UPI0015662E0B|nr:HNH endonuclease signature motif containing protein [Frigoribacterium sp. VKM Ac-2836]NRD25834.1 HNH endonuclease [Frigoribacterium sp. VKM Ac-2836]